MTLKINEHYILSLLNGMNEFMGAFKPIVIKVGEIEQQLIDGRLDKGSVAEFTELAIGFGGTVRAHRIYLTPLIPFGYSDRDVGVQALHGLINLLDISLSGVEAEMEEEVKTRTIELIRELKSHYASTSVRVNKVLADIHSGKSFSNSK